MNNNNNTEARYAGGPQSRLGIERDIISLPAQLFLISVHFAQLPDSDLHMTNHELEPLLAQIRGCRTVIELLTRREV